MSLKIFKCGKCGTILAEDADFCVKCGTKITKLKRKHRRFNTSFNNVHLFFFVTSILFIALIYTFEIIFSEFFLSGDFVQDYSLFISMTSEIVIFCVLIPVSYYHNKKYSFSSTKKNNLIILFTMYLIIYTGSIIGYLIYSLFLFPFIFQLLFNFFDIQPTSSYTSFHFYDLLYISVISLQFLCIYLIVKFYFLKKITFNKQMDKLNLKSKFNIFPIILGIIVAICELTKSLFLRNSLNSMSGDTYLNAFYTDFFLLTIIETILFFIIVIILLNFFKNELNYRLDFNNIAIFFILMSIGLWFGISFLGVLISQTITMALANSFSLLVILPFSILILFPFVLYFIFIINLDQLLPLDLDPTK